MGRASLVWWAAAALLLPAAPVGAQDPEPTTADDARFAEGLRSLGYFDLSKEVLEKLVAAAPNEDQKARARFGLARVRISEIENTANPARKLELIETAAEELKQFIEKYPTHPILLEVKEEMGGLLQQKAEACAQQARRDRARLAASEEALAAAEAIWRDIEAGLNAQKVDPRDERRARVLYNLGMAMWSYIDLMKDFPEKDATIDPKLDKLIELYDKFGWDFPDFLYYFAASDVLGRAYKIKAQRAAREEADRYWKGCFTNMHVWSNLVSKDHAANATARELAARGCRSEMQVLLEYADGLGATAAADKYKEIAALPEKIQLFTVFAGLDAEEHGKWIRLEQAKALMRAGKGADAKKIADALLAKEKPDSIWRIRFTNMMTDMGGDLPPAEMIKTADAMVQRYGRYLEAIQSFRKAIDKLETKAAPADLAQIGQCWYSIGLCYYQIDRLFEAERAFGMLNFDPRLSGLPADTLKQAMAYQVKCRKRLKGLTGDAGYTEWIDQLVKIQIAKYPDMIDNSEQADRAWNAHTRAGQLLTGARRARQPVPTEEVVKAADEAIDAARKIVRGAEEYELMQFVIGRSHYYAAGAHADAAALKNLKEQKDAESAKAHQRFGQAIDAFADHLRAADGLPTRSTEATQRALGSVLYLTRIALDPQVNKPEQVLKATEGVARKFEGTATKDLMEILANRILARLKLMGESDAAQLAGAEEDLKDLSAVFDRVKAYPDYLAASLIKTANAMNAQAKKLRATDEAAAAALERRAGDYFGRASDITDLDNLKDPEQLISFALSIYGQAEASKDPARFTKAYELFEKGLALGKHDKDRRNAVRRYMVLSLSKSGKLDAAVTECRFLTDTDPDKQMFWAWELLADLYRAKMEKASAPADRAAEGERAADIYGQLRKRLYLLNKLNESYWRLSYKYLRTLMDYDLDKLYPILYREMQRTPRWDEGEFTYEDGVKIQVKFKDLVRRMRQQYTAKPLPEDPPEEPAPPVPAPETPKP
jgi:hypothetical protein